MPPHEEKNILQRTLNLILYDYCICLYTFLLIFFVVWNIIGHTWNGEASKGICGKDYPDMLSMHILILIMMWIFLGIGSFLFIYTLIVYACDEGSCTLYEMCRCSLLCLSCGCCDLGKKKKKEKPNKKSDYMTRKLSYNN